MESNDRATQATEVQKSAVPAFPMTCVASSKCLLPQNGWKFDEQICDIADLAQSHEEVYEVTVYIVAHLKIHDRARYERYVADFMPILVRFDGKLLAADETPERIEGVWSGDKVVLLCFPDNEHFRRWVDSDDYRRIAVDRRESSETVVLLLRGL